MDSHNISHTIHLSQPRPASPAPEEEDKQVVIKNIVSHYILHITAFVAKPGLMITVINAANLAAYAVEEYRSPISNKVMKIIKYRIPMAYAACYGWMGAYKVSTLSQTSHNDANCYQPASPAATNPDENASSSV